MSDGRVKTPAITHFRPKTPAEWQAGQIRSVSVALDDRHCEVESSALVQDTFEPDMATLHLYQALADAESQACPIGRFLRLFGPEILLENLSLIVNADSYTIIPHPNVDHLQNRWQFWVRGPQSGADLDLAALPGIFIGIADQIDDDLNHPCLVRPQPG